MISKDLDRERGAMEVMAPGFQGMDNHKEFLVVDIIVSLAEMND